MFGADARVYIFDATELFAPTVALSSVASQRMSAAALLAPAAALLADARTYIFDTAEALAPAVVLNAAALQTMQAQAAFAAATTLTANLTTGAQLWQGSALLTPNAVFGADAQVFIFDSAEAFTVATTLAAVAAIGVAGTASLNPTTALSASVLQQMRASALLAPLHRSVPTLALSSLI